MRIFLLEKHLEIKLFQGVELYQAYQRLIRRSTITHPDKLF